jgi:putative zinc finger/helix-turn-helix YgiT family protein
MSKCEQCGNNLTIKSGQTHHYTESGVENVYLENLEVEVCRKCKTVSPRLRRIRQLHETIGRAIGLQPAPLAGQQLRYLRKHLGFKARELAALLRVDAATISRWEAGERPIGPQSDLLVRLAYFHLLAERGDIKLPDRMVEQLASTRDAQDQLPSIVINADNPGGYAFRFQTQPEKRSRRAA